VLRRLLSEALPPCSSNAQGRVCLANIKRRHAGKPLTHWHAQASGMRFALLVCLAFNPPFCGYSAAHPRHVWCRCAPVGIIHSKRTRRHSPSWYKLASADP
jgi:hypothetical protein